ncbi:MAG: hypothetical protein Kow0037_16060 [Calditrichia bacterium]
MITLLRFFHLVGIIILGGFVTHDALSYIFLEQTPQLIADRLPLFYFVTLPAIIAVLISGILLIVLKPYYFRKEVWLQKKFFSTLVAMFVMFLGISTTFKEIAQTGAVPQKFSPLFYSSFIFVFFIVLYNLYLSIVWRSKNA